MKKLPSFLLLVVFHYNNLPAQFDAGFSYTIQPDAAGTGMGESSVANARDANDMSWNAAKLAFSPYKEIFCFSYQNIISPYSQFMKMAYLAGSIKVDSTSAFGFATRYLSNGVAGAFTSPANYTEFHPNEFSVDAAYSRKLSHAFSASITGKFLHSDIAGNVYSHDPINSWNIDVGTYYQGEEFLFMGKPASYSAGMTLLNVGPRLHNGPYDDVFPPIDFRFGIACTSEIDGSNSFTLQSEMDNYISDVHFPEMWTLGSGLEYNYENLFFARAGYRYGYFPFAGYFTFGGGVRYSVFSLDFSYSVKARYQFPYAEKFMFTLAAGFKQKQAPTDYYYPDNN